MVDSLQSQISSHMKQGRRSGTNWRCDKLSAVRSIVGNLPVLLELEKAIGAVTGPADFNMISHKESPINEVNSWHIDTHAIVRGFSVLFPVNHTGLVSLYRDSDFKVYPWSVDDFLIPERNVRYIGTPKVPVPERVGKYIRGQGLVLRQDGELPPTVHGVVSLAGIPYGNEIRRGLTIFDCGTPK